MNGDRKLLNVIQILLGSILIAVSTPSFTNESNAEKMRELTELADSGDVNAQRQLAGAYDLGFYGVRDGELAMKYYLMAANQGDAEAQNSVGSGLQAKGEYDKAFSWYERAARQGHGLAINNLAYLYDLGLGIQQDRQRALKLYTRAAELGRADSMWNIANMYGAGQLGDKDYFSVCVWTTRALTYSSGSYEFEEQQETFRAALQYVSTKLSREERHKCDAESNGWKPTTMESAVLDR